MSHVYLFVNNAGPPLKFDHQLFPKLHLQHTNHLQYTVYAGIIIIFFFSF